MRYKHMTQTSNLIHSMEMQIKITLRFPVRMTVIKKTPINVCDKVLRKKRLYTANGSAN